ncbi:PREDICTED: CD63 antigen-like [Papilio polytes]|uniref:Tetraspanin n=1 Tax=Papilio polytes TaxID=76194 RepID=I4DMY1_PAPPL|nr:CD63 antigen-like [Papilio polytes]BAM19271.1 tetraspanin 39D [Papilio polytes]
MAIGVGMSCVKYLLFCFNLLFALTGLIILIVGIWVEANSHPYINLTDEGFYTTGPVVLIIVGVIVFIVAFFGCCGAVKENHCMIVTFAIFLLVIFIAELAVGIAGYVKHDDIKDSIVRHLNTTIKEYPTNKEVQSTFDILQTDLQCCGIYGPGDWANNSMAIPDTCCAGREIKEGAAAACAPDSPGFHSLGCVVKLVPLFNDIALLLGGVGLGIALVQLVGVIFACCLARSIRSEYETV